ncbi:hypothetical protein BH23VER1_BH23VER1_05400 [soil metagenome]
MRACLGHLKRTFLEVSTTRGHAFSTTTFVESAVSTNAYNTTCGQLDSLSLPVDAGTAMGTHSATASYAYAASIDRIVSVEARVGDASELPPRPAFARQDYGYDAANRLDLARSVADPPADPPAAPSLASAHRYTYGPANRRARGALVDRPGNVDHFHHALRSNPGGIFRQQLTGDPNEKIYTNDDGTPSSHNDIGTRGNHSTEGGATRAGRTRPWCGGRRTRA